MVGQKLAKLHRFFDDYEGGLHGALNAAASRITLDISHCRMETKRSTATHANALGPGC
jgi:hypothetical protein